MMDFDRKLNRAILEHFDPIDVILEEGDREAAQQFATGIKGVIGKIPGGIKALDRFFFEPIRRAIDKADEPHKLYEADFTSILRQILNKIRFGALILPFVPAGWISLGFLEAVARFFGTSVLPHWLNVREKSNLDKDLQRHRAQEIQDIRSGVAVAR